MKSWLYVGAKVVCVDDQLSRGMLTKGAIYTVTRVATFSGRLHVDIAEAVDPNWIASPGHWRADRFAPVSTINTDRTIATLKQQMRDAVDRELVKARLGEDA